MHPLHILNQLHRRHRLHYVKPLHGEPGGPFTVKPVRVVKGLHDANRLRNVNRVHEVKPLHALQGADIPNGGRTRYGTISLRR